jgi:hypothetical protein
MTSTAYTEIGKPGDGYDELHQAYVEMKQRHPGTKRDAPPYDAKREKGAAGRIARDEYPGESTNPIRSFNTKTGLFERPHVTRPASKPAELGCVVNKSTFVHPDIAAHALTAYWQQVRYWDGMIEAARRSQSAPGWLRWETIAVRPQAETRPALTVIETTVADVAAELGKPDQLEKVAHWDNEGAIRLVNWLLDEHADPRRWNTARHIAEELVAEAEGRYDWKTGTITPKSPTDSRPYLERFTDAPANLTSSHIMAAIEDLAQTAAFQDAMRKGDAFQLGFGIRIKRGQHGCDIYCPLPPGRGERWGHMSRGIEVVNVQHGKYQPIGAQRFQGNVQQFVLDVLPRIVIEEAAA